MVVPSIEKKNQNQNKSVDLSSSLASLPQCRAVLQQRTPRLCSESQF